MSFCFWKQNSFKLFGLTIFKVSVKKNKLFYRLLGLPVWAHKSELAQLITDIQENQSFDVREIDQRVEALSLRSCTIKPSKAVRQNRVVFLASELYTSGGHTKCLREYINLLKGEYAQSLFLTRYVSTKINCQPVLNAIAESATIYGTELNAITWKQDIVNLYNDICRLSPKVIFVFIHPDDVYGAMLLALLKRKTNIGILYYPHASHYPNVGMSFADLSLHNLSSTAWITREKRKFPRTHLFGMISKKLEDFPVFTHEQITERKRMLGLKDGEICVMSGGAAYKFFDNQASSEFFQTVKKIMEARQNVRAIILSNFNSEQTELIENIFSDSSARERLVLSPLSTTYELSFICADVFLDSFPVSAALTMVDLMRLRVPAVVKINRKNILWSFHEYQRPDYPYMFEKTDDLIKGVLRLIDSKSERNRIAEMNYDFYMSKYEGNVCRKRLCRLINNYESLNQYIDTDSHLFTPRDKV